MRAAVVGCGAVGGRVARQLLAMSTVDEVVLSDTSPARADAVARALGNSARVHEGDAHEPPLVDVAVLATPAQAQLQWARNAVRRGISVVSLTDAIEDVQLLLGLSEDARAAGVSVVVGAGFCPGLSCVLARFAAERFDDLEPGHSHEILDPRWAALRDRFDSAKSENESPESSDRPRAGSGE